MLGTMKSNSTTQNLNKVGAKNSKTVVIHVGLVTELSVFMPILGQFCGLTSPDHNMSAHLLFMASLAHLNELKTCHQF